MLMSIRHYSHCIQSGFSLPVFVLLKNHYSLENGNVRYGIRTTSPQDVHYHIYLHGETRWECIFGPFKFSAMKSQPRLN
jgi:hypothetical protein